MDDPIIQKLLADNGWITEAQIAAFEGVEPDTIMQRRSRGKMPNHFKVGKTIVYKMAEYVEMVETDRLRVKNPPASAQASQDLLDGAA